MRFASAIFFKSGAIMEDKKIIVILVVVIVVLAAVLGAVLFSLNSKEATKLTITSNKTQNEGGKLAVQLTDLNKSALSEANVIVKITDSKGNVVVNETLKTNSKGKANLDLNLKKGKYNVTVKYNGNGKYAANTSEQKLTIKEKVQETTSKENTVDESSYSSYSSKVGSYKVVDRQQELGVIESSDGNYYVMAGDGIYTYEGRDSKGNIQYGSHVG